MQSAKIIIITNILTDMCTETTFHYFKKFKKKKTTEWTRRAEREGNVNKNIVEMFCYESNGHVQLYLI